LWTLRSTAVTVLLLGPVALSGQQEVNMTARPTVAVLPILSYPAAHDDANQVATTLTRRIASAFSGQSSILVIGPERVARLRLRQPELAQGHSSEEAALRAGRALGARYVVVSSASLDGQIAQLDVRTLDVVTGSSVGLPFSAAGGLDELSARVDELVGDITRYLESSGPPATARRIPVEASMAYARGLDYEKRGRRDAAALLFERALHLYPRHDQARTALHRLRNGGRQ
jgi:TolB-like protein